MQYRPLFLWRDRRRQGSTWSGKITAFAIEEYRMQTIQNVATLRTALGEAKHSDRSIGLVPTMGFLHDGHRSLIRRARTENEVVVVSVFVNPTQFGPNEDLTAYPRDTPRDLALIQAEEADIAFFPSVEEIYPHGFTTYVTVEGLMTQTLCGRSRPTHFRGVTTVVSKLFHLVRPQRAYFGQKDAQQVAVLSRMVRDLEFDLDLVVCPTIREPDGLAMSSRNTYLTPEQRAAAPGIFRALAEAVSRIRGGERRAAEIANLVTERIKALPEAVIDYVAVVESTTLADMERISGDALIAVAVKLGRTRLIDNVRLVV
jgi:pantoate--beta-alanine ligase